MDNDNQFNFNQSEGFTQAPPLPPDSQIHQPESEPNGMATAALVLGIISVITICCCCLGLPLGALAVLFAILSKGSSAAMLGRAKTGFGLGLAACIITALLGVFVLAPYLTYEGRSEFVNEFRRELERQFEFQEGPDFDSNKYRDMLDEYFPEYDTPETIIVPDDSI